MLPYDALRARPPADLLRLTPAGTATSTAAAAAGPAAANPTVGDTNSPPAGLLAGVAPYPTPLLPLRPPAVAEAVKLDASRSPGVDDR